MYEFQPGDTGKSILVKLRDSTTGQGKTGLAYNSSGAACGYMRLNTTGSATSIALATLSTPTSAWSSGGFKEVDSTNQKGVYRFDVPNAVLASGSDYATVSFTFDGTIDTTIALRLRTPEALAGSGTISWTITVTDNSAVPLPGAQVFVTSDSAGANLVAGTLTADSLGQVTVYLSAGSYYVWVTDPGYNGTNPTAITIS